MNTAPCDRLALADLTDYAAGEMSPSDAEIVEAHLFACADCGRRAAEAETLLRAIGAAVRTAEVGGFVTDAVLNRLSRDGVRIRTFVLAPGAVVPCAVWEDDELMVLRLRGDFGMAEGVTLTQRVAGTEVVRITGQMSPGPHGEVLFAIPAATIRQLPVVDVDVRLTVAQGGEEREAGRYTLAHGGALRR